VPKLTLFDVDDVFGLAHGIVSRSGLHLSWHDREDLVAYLAELAWELSLTYDAGRGSFSNFATVRLRQRTTDWMRQRKGRTVWKFKTHTYVRPRVDLVSLDGGRDPLAESLAALDRDLEDGGGPACSGLLADRDRTRARDLGVLGLGPAQ
jgi:DNA-directed RNA polymerase specialized sigma24 family protein